jgi:hypothetical protein
MTKPHPDLDPSLTGAAGHDNPETHLAAEDDSAAGGPARRCIATSETCDKSQLIRFVLSPDGVVTPDLKERLGGRGVWVSNQRAVLEDALRRSLFARAFRAPVKVPDDLAGQIERLLLARCIQQISLARKAGGAVCGYEKVEEARKKWPGGLLFRAIDPNASTDQKPAPYGALCVLTPSELGEAFGRDAAVHAFVRAGPMAASVKAVYERLQNWRRPVLHSLPSSGKTDTRVNGGPS